MNTEGRAALTVASGHAVPLGHPTGWRPVLGTAQSVPFPFGHAGEGAHGKPGGNPGLARFAKSLDAG